MIAFLVNDCCDGHPELCNLVAADAAACCAAGVYEGAVRAREEGRRQAQELIVGTGHDLDDLGNGRFRPSQDF